MTFYRCDECGEDIRPRFRIVAVTDTDQARLHFCTVNCLHEWAETNGFEDAL